MGSNQQPLDSKSNALPTALYRKICEVRFKTVTVQRYSIATLHHACIIILYKNIIERVVVYVNI